MHFYASTPFFFQNTIALKRRKQGFFLIEFAVSISLFVVLLSAGAQIFFAQNRYLKQIEIHSEVCQSLENHLQELRKEILDKQDETPILKKISLPQIPDGEAVLTASKIEPFLWTACIKISWNKTGEHSLCMLVYKETGNEK